MCGRPPSRPPYDAALGLLARREHSRLELRQKLRQRGYDEAAVAEVLARLDEAGLVSDARFAKAFAAHKLGRGYGPAVVRAELRRRGVAGGLIDGATRDLDWEAGMRRSAARHGGGQLPAAPDERDKCRQYLYRRGYSQDMIGRLFSD